MDSARSAVSDFLHRGGKKDTTVHESVAPAVTHETVSPNRHEEVTTAVDKEVHQDHYHTSVQPIQHREVLPEEHKHNLAGVKHVDFDHDDKEHNRHKLSQEAAKYRDQSVTAETQHTQSTNPTVAGEHVHHHVHETVQPIIQKETVQPSVVHTTVPIHETHHNAAQHHATRALPAMTMDEFKQSGGVLEGGRKEHHHQLDGEPTNIGGSAINRNKTSDSCSVPAGQSSGNMLGGEHLGHNHNHGHMPATEPVGDNYDNNRLAGGVPSAQAHSAGGVPYPDAQAGTQQHRHQQNPAMAAAQTAHGNGPAHNQHNQYNDANSTMSQGSATHKKPSLMDKLNPKIDSNGDGKKGFMS